MYGKGRAERGRDNLLSTAAWLGMIASIAGASAAELHVPADYATIQAAINAAQDGDTVIVADGVYTGTGNRDIDFLGKAITVRSVRGPAHCTIDCQGSDEHPRRGFHFHSLEQASSVLDGFTIRNGYAPHESGCHYSGGGILCRDGSNPTIRNCILVDNVAPPFG